MSYKTFSDHNEIKGQNEVGTVKTWGVRQGGLMRCCLATISETMEAQSAPPMEGETLNCKYHSDNGGMIFRDGAWEWNRPHRTERGSSVGDKVT